jgi:hypothetical protein
MADTTSEQIPKGPGDYIAPQVLKDPELSTPAKIVAMAKDYAVGAIKGITTDLAGTPVDLMNLLISPATQALGIYSDNPVGGSKDLRERAGVGVEDANLRETAGNLLTPGGVAHAMIVAATRVGRDTNKANRMMNEFINNGMTRTEAEGRVFAETGVYVDRTDAFKTVISDAGVKIRSEALQTVRYKDEAPQFKSGRMLPDVIDAPELFKLYPELKKLAITPQQGNLNSAVYNGQAIFPWIGISPGSSQEQLRKTLLHEIQHGIQDIENFASKGSNPDFEKKFGPVQENALKNVKTRLEQVLKRKNIDSTTMEDIRSKTQGFNALRDRFELDRQNAFKKYQNNPGEQEARFTQNNADLSQESLGQEILNLILSGKTPQSHDTQALDTIVRKK